MRIILNETLKSKGKSQYWLAKETGISAAAINNLCNGKTTSIQFALVDKICLALDCNVSDIFYLIQVLKIGCYIINQQ